ncbi:MAG: hypothetical protein HYU51_18705 [Candidatus Rokubacteria bacterium]|nr:hypothetical protein [Candidatus Rokubacteria bacterium]
MDNSIKDTCLLCARPVYEDDRTVRFLSVWVHDECYRKDIGVPPRRRPQFPEERAA